MAGPIDHAKAKAAIDELMKTPEGQELAEKIRGKLKNLNMQFKGLSQDDKQKFVKEFQGKFTETFEELKDSLKSRLDPDAQDSLSAGENEDIPLSNLHNQYSPQPSYTLFLIAFIAILIIFGQKIHRPRQ